MIAAFKWSLKPGSEKISEARTFLDSPDERRKRPGTGRNRDRNTGEKKSIAPSAAERSPELIGPLIFIGISEWTGIDIQEAA
jgi:hypothetical protein